MFNKQKQHLRNKLDGVQRMIWDLEFKRFKTLEIREDIRKEYDTLRSKLEIVQTQIKREKETPVMPEGDRKRLEDAEVRLQRDIDRTKAQVDGLDVEANGANKSAEYPDGVQGISQQIDALHELDQMLREYIKNI